MYFFYPKVWFDIKDESRKISCKTACLKSPFESFLVGYIQIILVTYLELVVTDHLSFIGLELKNELIDYMQKKIFSSLLQARLSNFID